MRALWFASVIFILMTGMLGCGGSAKDDASEGKSASSAPAAADKMLETAKSADSVAPQIQNQAQSKPNADQNGGKTSAPTAPTASAGSQPSGGLPAGDSSSLYRKIIYKANVTMEVADYGTAQTEIKNRVHLSGGYIVQFSENRTAYEQSGTLVVKVPSNGFTDFLADLEQMKPKTIQQSIQGQDVTEEYVDLGARLKAKQVVEGRLLSYMEKASKTDELLAFSGELGKVQEEIEKIKGRMSYLEQNVAFSTIEIRVYQKAEAAQKPTADEEPAPFWTKVSKSMMGSVGVILGFFKGLLIFAAGAFPVIAVLALAGWPIYLLVRKHLKRRALMEERSRVLREENKNLIT